RQRNVRKLRRKGLRQVDDPHLPGKKAAGQLGQDAHADSSRSSALGLSRQRSSHSCATSPGYTSSTPSCRALTVLFASAAGASLGGGSSWFHSSSIGPGNTLTTRTPPGRISARRHCDSECAAAFDAEKAAAHSLSQCL